MQKTLQVSLPYPKSLITQKFGANANTSYARDGLKGHTAYDWGAEWGSPIPNCTPDAYCYSRMHENDKWLNDYHAVFFIVETESGVYEVSYGHLSGFVAEVGKTYQVGDIIGYVGNTGDVFSGKYEVTEAEKEAGSHAGAHLHGPQIRPVEKVRTMFSWKHYLATERGIYQDDEGYYYLIPNYDNGYNGCVSLAPFSTEKVAKKIDAQTATEVVAAAAKAVEMVQDLPPEQRARWFDPLKKILTALAGLFK